MPARHTYEAQADAYRNTVFQAFDDVEDQLSALRILEQESDVEQRAVDAAQHSFDLSNTRYKGGVTSYLEVLTAEQTLLQNQLTAINIREPAIRRQREPGARPRRRLGRNPIAVSALAQKPPKQCQNGNPGLPGNLTRTLTTRRVPPASHAPRSPK